MILTAGIVLFYIESKNIIHVNYIYHILEFIQVDKDYIRLAFKYSARIENQHIILIFFAILHFNCGYIYHGEKFQNYKLEYLIGTLK